MAADALASDRLHLILMPTEACNFRCTYCYEDFRLGRMREEEIRGVERLLDRRAADLARLDVSWFGGEPLLARDVVQRILGHIAELRARHPTLAFRSDMTTNGYLLEPEVLQELHGLGVTRYMVAFDGPAEIHDRKRIRPDGGGTFARLWGNLLAIRTLPLAFQVVIRLHVDRENTAACRALVDRLACDFNGDPRFPLFARLLARWGGRNDCRLAVLEPGPGRETVEMLQNHARARGVPVMEPGVETPLCCAARGNSFVIRADGRVNKCTLALNAPENEVGRLEPDGRLTLSAGAMSRWMRGLWTGSPDARACPRRGLVGSAKPEAVGAS